MKLLTELNRLLKDEEGLTVVEYAIAGGVIATGVVAMFTSIGTEVREQITLIDTDLKLR